MNFMVTKIDLRDESILLLYISILFFVFCFNLQYGIRKYNYINK